MISETRPGKVRIVHDCAAKLAGVSLNNQCYQGPDLINKGGGGYIGFTLSVRPSACPSVRLSATTWNNMEFICGTLTHWSWNKMDAISQTTCSSAFSWMKMFGLRLKFNWSLFLRVQLKIIMAWRRPGDNPLSETMMVNSLRHICVTRPQWVNTLTPRQNSRNFIDDIFKCFFLN